MTDADITKIERAINDGDYESVRLCAWLEGWRALSAKLAEAEAALAAYREMHSEINAQSGPNVVRLQMQARRDRIRAEAAEAERDEALGVLQEMRDDKTGFRDTVHFRRRAAAFLAFAEKGGE